jgi:hypothetical protein
MEGGVIMQRKRNRGVAPVQSDEQKRLIAEVRKAQADWNLAEWRFHDALGEDHVDYAIYCLEAAEKKLEILLREAKWHWSQTVVVEEGEVTG